MNTRTISARYGSGRNTADVYVYPQRDGSAWYAIDGSLNVNLAPDDDELQDGVNVEEIADIDTSTAGSPIDSEEALQAHVDDEPEQEGPTDEQEERADELESEGKDALNDLAEELKDDTDRPAVREGLNNRADTYCREEIAQAELKDEITAQQAEELREAIHAHAGGCSPDPSSDRRRCQPYQASGIGPRDRSKYTTT